MRSIAMTVNGEKVALTPEGVESLLEVLRDRLELTGSKGACEEGECGSCSVLLDDELVCSCLVMAADCEGRTVITVEGLGPEMNHVQEAMRAAGSVQCGFCIPGFVVAATHLMAQNSAPTEPEIREALAGNLCRCTGYAAILRALISTSRGAL